MNNRKKKIELARDSTTPKEVLSWLALDKDIDVVMQVAINANTPIKTLEEIAKHKITTVRNKVLNNPNVDSKIKEIIENTNQLNKPTEEKHA